MALEFGEATMGTLKQPTQNSTCIEVPQNMQQPQLNQPEFATQEEQSGTFEHLPNIQVAIDDLDDNWKYELKSSTTLQEQSSDSTELLEGNLFKESPNGYILNNRGNVVCNATFEIEGQKNQWIEDRCRISYFVGVKRPEAWGDEHKIIEVPSERIKECCQIASQTFPGVFTSNSNKDVPIEYMARVFQRDVEANPNLPVIDTSLTIGWFNKNSKILYSKGEDDFYKKHIIPDVSDLNKLDINMVFNETEEIGHGNDQIVFLKNFSHSPYVLPILQKANADSRNVILFKGKNNSMKTSTVSPYANVFCLDRRDSILKLDSRPASLRDKVVMLPYNLILVDDHSNSVGRDNKLMTGNTEMLIRARGDDKFGDVLDITGKNKNKFKPTKMLSEIILTAEEELGLNESSMSRLVTVNVDRITFDGKVLRYYQEHPEIFRLYFALFIHYITMFQEQIEEYCKETFQKYRDIYSEILNIPRLIDFVASKHLLADIVRNFDLWCGVLEDIANARHNRAIEANLNIVKSQQNNTRERSIVFRFIYALKQTIDPNQLAIDEETYVKDEIHYIGFVESEKSYIWLNFEVSYELVRQCYRKLGEEWTHKAQTVKEELLREGISVGKLVQKGEVGAEYLCRAKKGSRKRMLVLKMDEVERILNENEEETL